MTCGEVRDRIAPFLDGQLPEDEARVVAVHLDECEACRQLVLGLGALPLGRHGPPPVRSPEFWGSMDRALKEAARQPPSQGERVKAWFRAPVTTSRGVAILVLAVLAATIGLHLVRPGAPPPPLPIQAQGPPPPTHGAIAPVSHTPVRHQY